MTATLPRVLPSPDDKPLPPPGTAAAFRTFAQDLATSRRPWTPETAQFIAEQFDRLAAEWDANRATGRDEPVRDALARGGPLRQGPCLELGSGTGLFTPVLEAAFPRVISIAWRLAGNRVRSRLGQLGCSAQNARRNGEVRGTAR
ncbi:hypothetical protein [Streptomyces longhuiensis]|uniref:hypothetical protein n=1 Tax=Streptomyces TaxID=1883 RepID=UPI001D0A453C|nr:hypothetical protein [Streptomyces longhuiensis]UDM04592.1 hypothetical protein LGI35_43290 [Streptomyces longhuiensis]